MFHAYVYWYVYTSVVMKVVGITFVCTVVSYGT